MSEYIDSIEKDYNDGKITLDEITKLREDYNKLSAYDKRTLDIKYKKAKSDSKTNKPPTKINYQEKVVNLLVEQNSKLSTIKGILQFYLILTILSIITSIILFL
jgi:hypothetical protein